MTTESEVVVGKAPTFGTLSVAAPFLGAFLIFVLLHIAAATEIGFFLIIFLIPMSPLMGVILAIGAWKRRERYGALRWIGLLFNLAIIVSLIIGAPYAFRNLNWGGHGN